MPLVERQTYSVDEAARLLGVTRQHVRKQMRLGTLPSLQLGPRVLVPRPALEQMLGMPVRQPAPLPADEMDWR
jgi:excisionase family DNA binding protein